MVAILPAPVRSPAPEMEDIFLPGGNHYLFPAGRGPRRAPRVGAVQVNRPLFSACDECQEPMRHDGGGYACPNCGATTTVY